MRLIGKSIAVKAQPAEECAVAAKRRKKEEFLDPRFRSWIHSQISQMPQIEGIPKADDLAVASSRPAG
jgi:hypothetical protein